MVAIVAVGRGVSTVPRTRPGHPLVVILAIFVIDISVVVTRVCRSEQRYHSGVGLHGEGGPGGRARATGW